MKKLSIAFILITVSLSAYAQSISFGFGTGAEKVPLFGTATIGLPIEVSHIKINPYLEYTTFPLQRLEKYQQPYLLDQWKAGLNADFGYAYFKYYRVMSSRSYQQRKLNLGTRYQEFQPYIQDANVVECGFKFTFHTIKID